MGRPISDVYKMSETFCRMNRFACWSMGDGTAPYFLPAMITLISIGIISSVVAFVVARAVATAPIGYEDHAGFHEGVAAGNESGLHGRAVSRSTPATRKTPSLLVVR